MEGNRGDTPLIRKLLLTVTKFLEEGFPGNVCVEDVRGYFDMCDQIEKFHEVCRQQGLKMSFNLMTKVLSLSSSDTVSSIYDFSRLADKMLERFSVRWVRRDLLNEAFDAYRSKFGNERFTDFVTVLASTKQSFIAGPEQNPVRYNFHEMLFMEAFETVAHRPDGNSLVTALIRSFVNENECAESVISMFVVKSDDNPSLYLHLKTIMLDQLFEKWNQQPHLRFWLNVLFTSNLVNAVNAYGPLLRFVLTLIDHLSNGIRTGDVEPSHWPPYTLTYPELLGIVIDLYKNPPSRQATINFVFNQQKDRSVWTQVNNSCLKLGIRAVEFLCCRIVRLNKVSLGLCRRHRSLQAVAKRAAYKPLRGGRGRGQRGSQRGGQRGSQRGGMACFPTRSPTSSSSESDD